jgi:hypothetical protein
MHFKGAGRPSTIIVTVESENAACLQKSMFNGELAFHRENDYDRNELRNRFGVIMAPNSTGGCCRAHGDRSRGPLRHT